MVGVEESDGGARGARGAVDEAFRNEWGRVVATLIRVTGDWDLAEECAQEAFAQALTRWPVDGVPRSTAAWLTTAARNRAVDRIRRRAAETNRLRSVAITDAVPDERREEEDSVPDDRLQLMFTCCHPALPIEARVALTLRTLAGLTTPEIARAFLVDEKTMAQRIVRAKRKIRNAGIPYRVPPAHLLPERTFGVLGVLYLMFNEGYSASTGADLIRQSLSAEAIRLVRVLIELLPDEPEARGLLALMLFHDARRAGRVDANGDMITLAEQDRSRWDQATIDEALRLLTPGRGPYRIQAAIAALHATAPHADDTDWPQIASLYGELAKLVPSPVVELNRAVAIAMADGPALGLTLLDRLAETGALATYHLLPASRADLLRRLGRDAEAVAAYREALELAPTDAERRFLRRRIESLT
ncbi:RNA polymerase sigma factor [Virgisporangium aurantiacum]|uniref:RNA polymerase sigma factor n=1 Tax=Virgisporangium aurantiacum TaxID=175570 RepID=UPI00194E2F65|nr:RNA polymerase sigma factor [Virgisporangium aurantiacum]